ncbi:MAG TPA: hypothetical protein VG734_07520 [Lacunisphaera sp.]|nr:hypothetical protein [Lacunisphaera sp.]
MYPYNSLSTAATVRAFCVAAALVFLFYYCSIARAQGAEGECAAVGGALCRDGCRDQ